MLIWQNYGNMQAKFYLTNVFAFTMAILQQVSANKLHCFIAFARNVI